MSEKNQSHLEEIREIAAQEGIELTDDMLEEIAGGIDWSQYDTYASSRNDYRGRINVSIRNKFLLKQPCSITSIPPEPGFR